MLSPPMSARSFRNGVTPRGYPRIPSRRSARVDTSNASPRNARPATRGTSPPMPKSSASKPYLAFDFGAESGRAVLAHLESGILTTEEVHRFANKPVEYGGSLHWDLPRLWLEVRRALT